MGSLVLGFNLILMSQAFSYVPVVNAYCTMFLIETEVECLYMSCFSYFCFAFFLRMQVLLIDELINISL